VSLRRKASFVDFDGKPLLHWEADWSRIAQAQLPKEPGFFPPQAMVEPFFGVGACWSGVTFPIQAKVRRRGTSAIEAGRRLQSIRAARHGESCLRW
jgi:hypothetical protein